MKLQAFNEISGGAADTWIRACEGPSIWAISAHDSSRAREHFQEK